MLSEQKLFLEASYSINDIVRTIKIRYLHADKSGSFGENLKIADNASWISEQRHRKFGRCYTFYPDTDMQYMGIYYMKIELYVFRQWLLNLYKYLHMRNIISSQKIYSIFTF